MVNVKDTYILIVQQVGQSYISECCLGSYSNLVATLADSDCIHQLILSTYI